MRLYVFVLLGALLLLGTNPSGAEAPSQDAFSFVVIGHVRGEGNTLMNPWLDELLVEIKKLKPDMIFLTGDMIWGDIFAAVPDAKAITRAWDQLDAALGRLGVPIYRVPGNHDINDPVTRDIYFARYGTLPQAFTYRGCRFILLNSSYVPKGNDPPPEHRPYVRGVPLDAPQRDFIRQELPDNHPYDHVFLFMHHLLWWEAHAPWWREAHPLLVNRKVRMVLSGEYGPLKFSHMKRDGIDYIQSALEGEVVIEQLRANELSRVLYLQLDNFLHVTVNGSQVDVEIKTLDALSSGKFSPQRWRAMYQYERSWIQRVWAIIGKPNRLTALGLLCLACFLSGIGLMILIRK